MKKRSFIPIYLISGLILLVGCSDSENTDNKELVKLKASLAKKNEAKEHVVEIVRLDKRLVMVETSGLINKHISIAKMLEKYVEPILVNLNTGQLIDDPKLLSRYDEEKAINIPSQSIRLTEQQDPAGIKRRENIGKLYLIKDDDNNLDQILVPIRAFGRFSMIYGFLALKANDLSIENIGFYQHGETPGLGAEFVNNPDVAKQFIGKRVYQNDKTNFSVIINHAKPTDAFSVDGVSGATYTNRAVEHAINYWCGNNAYMAAIKKLTTKNS